MNFTSFAAPEVVKTMTPSEASYTNFFTVTTLLFEYIVVCVAYIRFKDVFHVNECA